MSWHMILIFYCLGVLAQFMRNETALVRQTSPTEMKLAGLMLADLGLR
jgi:hypothetical protein